MIASGRVRRSSGSVALDRDGHQAPRLDLASQGRLGEDRDPEGISTARLMFSMLSNSRTTSTWTEWCLRNVDGPADRQVGIEGHERLAVEFGHPDARPAREAVPRMNSHTMASCAT